MFQISSQVPKVWEYKTAAIVTNNYYQYYIFAKTSTFTRVHGMCGIRFSKVSYACLDT